MKLIQNEYQIVYKDGSSDNVIFLSNGKQTNILTEGFAGYSNVIKSSNSIKEIEKFFKRGKFVKSINLLSKNDTPKHKLISGKLIDVKMGSFPKQTGDWFTKK